MPLTPWKIGACAPAAGRACRAPARGADRGDDDEEFDGAQPQRAGAGSREPSPDIEALRRLEALQPAYERLRADRIRAESDVERLTRRNSPPPGPRPARELGTDDEGEIRRMIEEARAENARRVEAFAQALRAVQDRLDALDAGR